MLGRMRFFALALLAAVLLPAPARADGADGGYAALRAQLKSLQSDRRRGSRRDLWLSAEKKLDRFARTHAKSPHACDAAFLSAEAAGDLAGRSFLRADREDAAQRYRNVAAKCADSHLADDALYRAADIERAWDTETARDDLQKVLSRHASSDHAPLARKLLASLPKAEPAKAAAKPEPARPGTKVDAAHALAAARPGMPLSVLAGLKVHRVVIDAGHGGNDTGAIGPTGLREKEVTLAIARKLARRLEDAGLEVVLTRDSDKYVQLADRTALANERRGDLFISVHCNAGASRKWRGVETYTLNLNSDRYAARLAARENAGSEKGIGELQYILADLATKANTDDSVSLARAVQSELHDAAQEDGGKEARDLGVKQALFFVLVGARMPAILVETSFISNPEEEKLLKSASYQDDVAKSIADGVDRFIAERGKLATVF